MENLFESHRRSLRERCAPLAERMRPRTLDEVVGQEHVLGPGALLRSLIERDQLVSLILWGLPVVGRQHWLA
jgi:putative ATPase